MENGTNKISLYVLTTKILLEWVLILWLYFERFENRLSYNRIAIRIPF